MVAVTVRDVRVLVVNLDGEFLAIGSDCSHAGGPLASGVLRGRRVMCPWHGSEFDLDTGAAVKAPASRDVPVYPVRVAGGEIQVLLSEP